ncbi:hypothetical protein [Staphylococcus phage PMBT8]|nr:hypothetical protein [Staphylococcus phage PMBT8]
MNEYIKRNEESITAYWIRLYKNRQAYGLTFKECGDLMNEVAGTDWNEAKWRREMEGYLKVSKHLEMENPTGLDSSHLQEIQEEKLELEKEKIRMRDQRRILNTKIREMARLEHLEEYLKENVESIMPMEMSVTQQRNNEKEAMVVLSDFHIGMVINNKYTKYNKEIAKDRLNKVKQEVYNKLKQESISKLHIVHLGDGTHGHIHSTARIESEENVIEQLVSVSQMLESFIETFVQEGYDVTFYSVAGNHSRSIPNKKDSLGTAESFERLITVFLGKAFNKFDNYSQIDDEVGIINLDIKGKSIALAHGDMDLSKDAISKLESLLNKRVDYLFTGHVHNAYYKEVGQSVHIGVGSLCSLDSYAINKRFSGKPSQLYLTFDDNGIDSMKVVYLD